MREPSDSASAVGPLALSVVVPAFDEIEAIEPLLREVEAALRGRCPFEVVVVDDGSRDGTGERAEKLAGEWPWLRVVRHARNLRQSAALCSGVLAARGEWIATLDGDGQNDPADLPRLVALRDRSGGGALLVSGIRAERRDGWLRVLQSRVANALRARVLGDGCPDSACGIRLFRRADFLRLPEFDHMHRFLPALFGRLGVARIDAPVAHRPRRHGRSKYGLRGRLWIGIVDLVGVAWLIRRRLDGDTDVRVVEHRGADLAVDRVRRAGIVRAPLPGAVDRE